jgi:sulfotransferase family protein
VQGAGSFIGTGLARAAASLLRLVPGSAALRLKRDLRDAAWLAEADAVVVSFPKSGRTFVRAMVARLYQRRFGIDERKLLDFPMLRQAPRQVPRLLFTHAGDAMRTPGEIKLDPAAFAHAKVVLIARHPGDVAVSRYHHLAHRSRDRARRRLADQPLDQFVWTEQGGIPSIVAFLNALAALPGVVIIGYQDFLREPDVTLRKLSDAIGLKVGADDIADAAEFGQLDNLKKREREGYFTSSRLKQARRGDDASFKVRTGKSGGYRAELDAEEAACVDAYIDAHLDRVFGFSAA